MQEKENILRILRETKEAVKKDDVFRLKELSNQTIHTASISQDPDNIAVAVIVYTLGKIIERTNYQTQKGWKAFFDNFTTCIDKSIIALEKDKLEEFRKQIKCIREGIEILHGNFKNHIEAVFRKAQINKASKIYEHGISMEQTANLLGITTWELADYAGKSNIGDVDENITESEKIRIKEVMDFFK